jgi:putative oxidoreductase
MTRLIDRRRLLIPALGGLYDTFAPFAYPLMRFSTGAILLPHGVNKLLTGALAGQVASIDRRGLPFAFLLGVLTIFTESVSAACLALGLFTRIAALMIWIEMAVIITVYQWQFGYFWTSRGDEFALLWLLLCTAILFRGGGRYSLDRLIGREFQPRGWCRVLFARITQPHFGQFIKGNGPLNRLSKHGRAAQKGTYAAGADMM